MRKLISIGLLLLPLVLFALGLSGGATGESGSIVALASIGLFMATEFALLYDAYRSGTAAIAFVLWSLLLAAVFEALTIAVAAWLNVSDSSHGGVVFFLAIFYIAVIAAWACALTVYRGVLSGDVHAG